MGSLLGSSLCRLCCRHLLLGLAGGASRCIQPPPQDEDEDKDKPPPTLLLAAVACAASGTVLGVPVQRLREDDAIGSLRGYDWIGESSIGVIGAGLLGLMLPAATSVRSLRCVDGATPLAQRAQAAFPFAAC